MVVDGEQVWLVDEDGSGPFFCELPFPPDGTSDGCSFFLALPPPPAELPLDDSAAQKPAWSRTWIPSLFAALFRKVAGGRHQAENDATEEKVEEEGQDTTEADDTAKEEQPPAAVTKATGTKSSRGGAKVAGRRRKAGGGARR
jgi:hypothetical protein